MIPQTVLNKFASKINKKYQYINRGGCCVFAAHVAKQLQKHYPVKIVTFGYRTKKSVDDIRKNVKVNTAREWYANGLDLNHVVIEFVDEQGKIWHYDSTGVHKADGSIYDDPIIRGYLTVDEALEMASSPLGWNNQFDRSVIPEFKRMVHNHFRGFSIPLKPIKETLYMKFKNIFLKNTIFNTIIAKYKYQ